jgi:hypothetical protein
MTLRQRLKRLERALRGTLESFALADGTRHYYDPTSGERYLHSMDCLRAQYEGKPYPEPPDTIMALTKARDRSAALDQIAGGTFDVFPYDKEILVERGELVPRSMVAGHESGESLEDLSE